MEDEEREIDYREEIIKLLDKISDKRYFRKIYSFIKAFI